MASWSWSTARRLPTTRRARSRCAGAAAHSRHRARPRRSDREVFEDQIACADLVVLNKRDLLDAAGVKKRAGGDCECAAAQREGHHRHRRQGRPGAAAWARRRHGGRTSPIAAPGTMPRKSTITTISISFVVPLGEVADPSALAARVAALAEDFDVLRVKGFAAVVDKPMRLLVQAVGPRVTHQYDRPWAASETRQGQLVVIGLKGLDRASDRAGSHRVNRDASAHDEFDQPRRNCRSGRSRPDAGRHRRAVIRRQRPRRPCRRLGG